MKQTELQSFELLVIIYNSTRQGTGGGAVGRGTFPQAGRSRVRFPIVSLEFFIENLSGRSLILGLTQPLTEMSTRNIYWVLKEAGVRFDNLNTFMCRVSRNLGAPNSWNT
jgi:hypothetical protein